MNRIIYTLTTLLLLSGCYFDKSSTDYTPIGTITVTDIESSYSCISLVDNLTITPTITSSDPDDKVDEFEYLWTYHIPRTQAPYPIDTLYQFKGKDIVDWPINLKPGSYTLTLRVSNPNKQDYSIYKTTTIHVSTFFSSGYYFLKETAEGNTDLDFLSMDEVYAPNLLSRLDAQIVGKPTRLSQFEPYRFTDEETGEALQEKALIPMGGRDMKVLRLIDMSLINDFGSIFYDGVKPDEKPLFGSYTASLGNQLWFTNKGGYVHPAQYATTGKASARVTPENGCDFTGGVAVRVSGASSLVLFDDLNDRLVIYNSNGIVLNLSSSNGLEPTGIKHHLLFIGSSGWSVFQDDIDQSVRYLYQINYASASIATTPILQIQRIDATNAPNFSRADVYGSNKTVTAANVATTTLYGGVGDKLYAYNTGSKEETLLSPIGMESGEVITMITHKPAVPNPKNPSDATGLLMVGTYKNGNYKVYMYSVSGGVPDGEPALIATGVGRVADMQVAHPDATRPKGYNSNY